MSEDNKLLYHSQVLTDLNSVFTPHPGQVAIGKAIFYDDKKRVFIESGRKFGKQICLESEILTPSGFVRYGDLSVGDIVYDERGVEQSVTYLSPINVSPESYRVHFCNGTYIDACADHRWATHTKLDRRASRPTSIKTTKEIFSTLMHGKEYNHSIPYSRPIEMLEKDLLIDPYLFGCWLGDGGSHGARISSVDEEILDSFRSSYGLNFYDKCTYGILGNFVTNLKSLGLIGNKNIPSQYLLGSYDQRLSLLQGLMDTDGTINKEGNHCCFDNTNKNLSDGVFYLVASLGMKPMLSSRIGKLYGVEKKRCYRVMFKPLVDVFRLTRKACKIKANNIKSRSHTIVNVEVIESRPMRCISVSGDSHLYLVGRSLIPTHNTEMVIYILYRWCMLYPNSWCYYIAPFQNQIDDLVWANNRMPGFLPEKMMKKYNITINNSEKRVYFNNNNSFIKCDGADNHEKGRGYSATGISVYDEFKDHNPKFHDGFEPNLAITDAPLIFVGTPPDESEASFERWCSIADEVRDSPVGFHITRPSYTNPHVSAIYFERKYNELKAKGELWKWEKEYMAMRVSAGSLSIFPMLDPANHIISYKSALDRIRNSHDEWGFYISFDPGTASVFGVLIIAFNIYSKECIALDEIYADNFATNSAGIVVELAREKIFEIMPEIDRWHGVYDYAATWFLNEYQTNYDFGMFLNPCSKDLKNKENKLSLIKDMLLGDFLVMTDKCKKLFWEMKKYSTDEHGRIKKKDDHLIDNLRYILNAIGYDKVPSERPLPESELMRNRRKITMEEDFDDLKQGDIFGSIDSELFDN